MKTLIANWKMNVGIRESVALARGTLLTLRGRKLIPELVICPSFIALSEVRKIVARSSVSLGAQNVFWEPSGAYTGETSTRMLQEVGVSYVILGHSERRQELGETDEMIHKKVLHVLSEQMTPIVCIGESKQQHEAGQTQEVIRTQLISALSQVYLRGSERVLIAYEPLWAIGSGVVASVGEVIEVHQFIRSLLQELFAGVSSQQIPLLYGGSVDGENAYGFLREELIDGLLVGGASVKINQFKDIVEACGEVLEAQGI
ncbi:MAG: Triosephosphate isomerase [Candidatus Uhrbacteria bacterium GW2011_GWF2_39_13]|uniref:Triosephosphate isomerase n=1 Tax=Candidatus Uhrbacteria bacterium GW2011_GWF2_39_13 TaxID=1618995 RepID=A0A0G0MP01_9BACT|nr:MAG: Triosephosphate isomerase [Candidatus Uhrbacteria bacterium GW2011_GWF2_39_13]HAU66237.1 triose-phosphate isomerase [Candidatus Uhrbacteria bacterium]